VERNKAATSEADPSSGKYARSSVDTRTQLPNNRLLGNWQRVIVENRRSHNLSRNGPRPRLTLELLL
jgi:hypothetical protein